MSSARAAFVFARAATVWPSKRRAAQRERARSAALASTSISSPPT
jgi:hypothetical protein